MQIQSQLHQQLQTLHPTHLEILNESMNHGGYVAGKESHFKVTIVSDAFLNQRTVARHQQVYALVGYLLANKTIHALALHTYSPVEWTGIRPDSPPCVHAPK